MPSTQQMRLMYPEFVRSFSPLICDFTSAVDVEFLAGGTFGPTVKLKVHPACEEAFKALAQTFKAFGYYFHDPAGGTAVCRPITGGIRTSLHAHGICLDINPISNRYRISRGLIKWGVQTDMSREMIETIEGIRTKGGFPIWEWGGRWWNIKDPMHFQASKCTRAQLGRGVDWRTVPEVEDDMGQALKKGDRGNAVRKFQHALRMWNPAALPQFGADGDFGAETEEWVTKYQMVAQIELTGRIDGLTAGLLADYYGG